MTRASTVRKIYLIRHGTPEPALAKGRCIGKTDIPLCDMGREEAKAVGRWLESRGCGSMNVIITSPLARCTETAEIIQRELGGHIQIIIDDRISEIDCGKWDGMPFEEISKKYPDEYAERGAHIASYTIEGGESFFDVCQRFSECIEEIKGGTWDDVIVVSHAGAIRSFLAIELGYAEPDDLMSIKQVCGGVTIINEDRDGKLSVENLAYRP